jgi:hypothetical protein
MAPFSMTVSPARIVNRSPTNDQMIFLSLAGSSLPLKSQ